VTGVGLQALVPKQPHPDGRQRDGGLQHGQAEIGGELGHQLARGGEEPVGVSDLVRVDETAPYPKRQRYLYSATKAEAERLVLAASAPGFEALSIRPRFVWGPRDTSVLPAVLRMARAGNFAWIGGGRISSPTTASARCVSS
jgi:nucleoside-diphosphate-sugar epimerase